jgi:hypothetical protein
MRQAPTRISAIAKRCFYNIPNDLQHPNDSCLGKQSFNGGAALEVDWNGNVLWEIRQPGHHHDGRRLKNGSVLLLSAEEPPESIATEVQGGLAGPANRRTGKRRGLAWLCGKPPAIVE